MRSASCSGRAAGPVVVAGAGRSAKGSHDRGSGLARLILDTSILVAAERDPADPATAIADEDDGAIAAVTVAELLVGVELARGRRRQAREQYVGRILAAIPVEPCTVEVARAHAQLLAVTRRSGQPRGAHDLIIAATALTANRIVVAIDASGFRDLPGVQLREA